MYEMKESGIEWIGQIPKHWEVRKVKYIYNIEKAKLPYKFVDDDSYIPYMTMEYIRGSSIVVQYALNGTLCLENDILILWDGSNAGEIIYNHPIGYAPSTTAILRSMFSDYVYGYFKYNLKALEKDLRANINGMGIPHVNGNYLKNVFLAIPPLDEQQKIADFLDNKVSKIDDLISDTKNLIDKYKEYKQSLITEIVTKGLNHNVEMKESGIEWIGQIPKHWKLSRLKYLCDVRKRKNTQNIIMRYIGLENIESYTGKYKATNSEYSLIDAIICQTNDIIFGKLRPYLSKTYIVDEISCCSSEFIVLYNVDNVKFIFFLLLSNGFIDSMSQIAYGAKMPRVSDEDILNFYVPFPPLDEQEEIVKYLDDKCSQIDSIIEEKQSLIEKLEEYKKSLIYEYVTGKKQVENE